MAKSKKIPLRMCLGCNEMRPKKSLIRIAKSPDGGVSVDIPGKSPGRGAYMCKSAECFKKARGARRLERAFSRKIEDGIYDMIEREIENNEQNH